LVDPIGHWQFQLYYCVQLYYRGAAGSSDSFKMLTAGDITIWHHHQQQRHVQT